MSFLIRVTQKKLGEETERCFQVRKSGTRFYCYSDEKRLTGCSGHPSLAAALAGHEELQTMLREATGEITCPVMNDYEIAKDLRTFEGLGLTINGVDWWADAGFLATSIAGHEDAILWAASHWANVDTEGCFMFGISGETTLWRLDDVYEYWDTDAGDGESFQCSDPQEALRRFFRHGYVSHLQWLRAPALKTMEDVEISKLLGRPDNVTIEQSNPHVLWVNNTLWEWDWRGNARPKRAAHPTVSGLPGPLPERILIGPEPTTDRWIEIRLGASAEASVIAPESVVGEASASSLDARADESNETAPAADSRLATGYAVLLRACVSAGVDRFAYEQLLEAAFKWPQGVQDELLGGGALLPAGDFGDKQPPYAIAGFPDGTTRYGLLVWSQELVAKLLASFDSTIALELDASLVRLWLAAGANLLSIQSVVGWAEAPKDRSFEVRILQYG